MRAHSGIICLAYNNEAVTGDFPFVTGQSVADILPYTVVNSSRIFMDPVYRIDVERNFVALNWDEFPSLAQLREVVDNVVADPQFHPGMNFLWDRKPGAPNNATVEWLREAVHFLEVLGERIGRHAWAIVTHNASDFGKARMIEAMTDQSQVIVRAFQSCGDAEEWLRHPVRFEPEIVHFPARSPSLLHPRFA